MISVNVWTLFGSFFGTFLLYLLYNYFISPFLTLQFYKKQGLSTSFVPLVGYLKSSFENVLKHGDFYHSFKQLNQQDPRPQGFATSISSTVVLWLVDPEIIKEFYQNQERYYTKEIPGFVFFYRLLSQGMLFTEGQTWKRHRRLASLAFNYEFLKQSIPDVVQTTDSFLEKMKERDLSRFDMMTEIQVITGEVVGRVFFGEKLSSRTFKGQSITRALTILITAVTEETLNSANFLLCDRVLKAGVFNRHRKLHREIDEFKAFIESVVQQKFQELDEQKENSSNTASSTSRSNLIELFWNQRLQTPAEAFTDEEIVDEFITFFLAGMDTTGHLITHASYYYLANPQTHQKLLQEVSNVFESPSEVTIEALNQMDNMTAFMKETLRLTSPVMILFMRLALKDHTLANIKIKKGTLVDIPYMVNNSYSSYHQSPEEFIPERWIDDDSRTKKSVSENPHIFTPFSGGGRNCIGQHLAMNEARIIFSLFLKKFDFELADKEYKLRFIARFTYEPYEPIIYRLTPKNY